MAGGDSAARGMMLGAILGARDGAGAVPDSWLEAMAAKDEIRRLLGDLQLIVDLADAGGRDGAHEQLALDADVPVAGTEGDGDRGAREEQRRGAVEHFEERELARQYSATPRTPQPQRQLETTDVGRRPAVQRVIWRSLRRVATREVLWSGNQAAEVRLPSCLERWSQICGLAMQSLGEVHISTRRLSRQ